MVCSVSCCAALEVKVAGFEAPASGSAAYFDLYYRRLFAFGSSSPAGASLAFADGSVKFAATGTNLLVLRELSTRASGNVVTGDN